MNENVKLTIRTIQRFEAGTPDEVLSYQACGKYYERNGSCYILYEEVLEGFPKPFQTRVKIKKDIMELKRHGATDILMTFEKGKTHATDYITPFGRMLLMIETKKLEITKLQKEMLIKVSYTMHSNEQKISDTRIELKIVSEE